LFREGAVGKSADEVDAVNGGEIFLGPIGGLGDARIGGGVVGGIIRGLGGGEWGEVVGGDHFHRGADGDPGAGDDDGEIEGDKTEFPADGVGGPADGGGGGRGGERSGCGLWRGGGAAGEQEKSGGGGETGDGKGESAEGRGFGEFRQHEKALKRLGGQKASENHPRRADITATSGHALHTERAAERAIDDLLRSRGPRMGNFGSMFRVARIFF